MEFAAVIPCHNESETIGRIVRETRRMIDRVIVVNDGSTDDTAAIARAAGATVVDLAHSSGKGTALRTGLARAFDLGVTHAVCLDGDGQHLPTEAARLLSACDEDDVMVIGNRMSQCSSMPFIRRWTNRTMSRVLSLLTGTRLADSQCGFRIIPLSADLLSSLRSRHFEIESELILRASQLGMDIRFVEVSCVYNHQSSRIHLINDTIRWLLWLWESAPDRIHHKP